MVKQNDRTRFVYALAFCLYAITPAYSQQTQQAPVTNIAGPSASSTGSVTNQAVQVMNGMYMSNTYGGGVSCQGPSLNLSPFVYGGTVFSDDPETYRNHNVNPGISATFSLPLDNSLQQLCKDRAQIEIDRQKAETAKARLDFELVRLLKCGDAKKQGIEFHPESPYAAICSDIVVKK